MSTKIFLTYYNAFNLLSQALIFSMTTDMISRDVMNKCGEADK